MQRIAKKSRVQEIKEQFAEHLRDGDWGIYMWCFQACLKAERAAQHPNDPEAAREFKRWMRELKAYSLAPETYKGPLPKEITELTHADLIRARGLGVRLE